MSRYHPGVALCPVQRPSLFPEGQERRRALGAPNEVARARPPRNDAKLSYIAPSVRLRSACFSLVSDLSRLVCNIASRRSGALWEWPAGRIGELSRGGDGSADASVSCSYDGWAIICSCYELLPISLAAVPARVIVSHTSSRWRTPKTGAPRLQLHWY
jgi:hypothetical protein